MKKKRHKGDFLGLYGNEVDMEWLGIVLKPGLFDPVYAAGIMLL